MKLEQSLDLAVTIFTQYEHSTWEALEDAMYSSGMPKAHADRILEFMPLAFGRVLMDESGVSFSNEFERKKPGSSRGRAFPFAHHRVYEASFAYAVRQGFGRVVQVDGDLQHPPEAIPDLIAAADRGADLVIGSRFSAGYDVAGARRITMRLLAWLVSRRVGTRLDDVTSGFRVISEPLLSDFARQYPAEYLGDTVEAVLQAGASGATITQVSVPMEPRRHGSATPTIAAGGHMARLFVSMVARKPEGMAK